MGNKVEISSIDGRIWNSGLVAANIIHCLERYGTVVLDLSREGPDIQTTEIDSIIDMLFDLGYSSHQIQIHTGNVIEDYKKASIVKHPEWMFELE